MSYFFRIPHLSAVECSARAIRERWLFFNRSPSSTLWLCDCNRYNDQQGLGQKRRTQPEARLMAHPKLLHRFKAPRRQRRKPPMHLQTTRRWRKVSWSALRCAVLISARSEIWGSEALERALVLSIAKVHETRTRTARREKHDLDNMATEKSEMRELRIDFWLGCRARVVVREAVYQRTKSNVLILLRRTGNMEIWSVRISQIRDA